MTPDEILKAFDNIRVWQRGDRRAPHKPLLILMALGSLARGEKPRAEFAEIEDKLGRFLEEFGPSGSNATRHFPFWHLTTDKLWQLDDPAENPSRIWRFPTHPTNSPASALEPASENSA